MKRFDLLKSLDNKLWLINCVLRKDKLDVGLAVFFRGLPASIPVYAEGSDLIATVSIPYSQKIITSAAEADVSFALEQTS